MRSIAKAVGRRVAELRSKAGLNQAALGEKLGLGQVQVSRYETGKVSVSIERLAQIARVLRLNLHDFVCVPSGDPARDRAVEKLLLMIAPYSAAEIELLMDVGGATVQHIREINAH
jgi:transcriptional regulator with XRE-family HTH domain